MAALARMKSHWRRFKHDEPGHRFHNQYERTKRTSSRTGIALRCAAGIALVAGGVVLLFIPGPGLLVGLFGLALIASMSQTLADGLDRAEPPVRRGARAVKEAWQRLPLAAKIGLGVVVAAVAAGAGYLADRWLFA